MAQLIFGSSLPSQRKDQLIQTFGKILHSNAQVNYFYALKTAFLCLNFHKIYINTNLVHYFLTGEYLKYLLFNPKI